MTVTVADICFENIEELQEGDDFSEGDTVVYDDDGHVGVITGKLTETMEWPTGDEATEEIEASSDNPVYIVARETGGSKPYRADELDSITQDEAFGDVDVDPVESVEDVELARVYFLVSDPYDYEELQEAKKRLRQAREELVDVPGVDDPEVGWSSFPDSWEESEKPARLILLDMWTTVGGTFTGCVSRLSGRIGRIDRFCAATKDEVLGTERWRNRF